LWRLFNILIVLVQFLNQHARELIKRRGFAEHHHRYLDA